MTIQNTFSIQFYSKKSKEKPSGDVPIYARITVNGKRAEISVKRSIHVDKWDNKKGAARGNGEYARSLNAYIDTVRNKLYEHHRRLIDKDEVITAQSVKSAYLNKGTGVKTLIEVFKYHNKQMKAMEGKEFAKATVDRYSTTLMHLEEFISTQYNLTDISLSKLNHQFITDLDFYLRTERKCNNNSTVKYIRNVRKVVNMAVDNDWLEKDPFVKYKGTVKPVEREFLTQEELAAIEEKEFAIERLAIVRDIFVFSCYTGYSYVEVQNLTPNNIVSGIDGETWIHTYREKTGTKSNVPLLPKALEIIEKYEDHPECKRAGKLLPIRTNQKMNAYLKEIADLCGLDKRLHYHVSRHTFATTVTLTNGVPIESVSSMLGHQNIRSTQVYARVVEKKVSADMLALKDKLESKEVRTEKEASNE